MKRESFVILIKSVGFEYNSTSGYFEYKDFKIDLYYDFYKYCDNLGCILYNINNLKPIENQFKNEFRSIKLKKILK